MANEDVTVDKLSIIEWAVECWYAEVSNRPMVNVHRRSLDDTWRQVLRHLGVDDRARLGPTHDELRAEISTKDWEAMIGSSTSQSLRALKTAIDSLEILDRRPRPMCRDCPDENGTCPGSGLPCDMRTTIKDARSALASLS